ncbi:c-type cytochrome [Flavobacterium sp. RHBU_3]|uniref:c-type cytochrome n=1 Tax=Flavobacterium sp. RHBU_3 TaxID=3391184 RepID=UPI0039853E86
MKKLLTITAALSLMACGGKKAEESTSGTVEVSEGDIAKLTPQETLGQEIFDGKGNCYTCHKPDGPAIGPSIKEIAKVYRENNGDMVTFLRGNGKPIVKPEQYEVMKTNFYLTKTFSDEELKAIEAYMHTYK